MAAVAGRFSFEWVKALEISRCSTGNSKQKTPPIGGVLYGASVDQLAIDERGLTGWLSLEMVTSTRRFMARPETLLLSATGYSLP